MIEEGALVVVVTHTVMSGQVARFYRSTAAYWNAAEMVSASRDGVIGGGSVITREAFDAAWAAYERLKRREDVSDIATHVRGFGVSLLEPVRPGVEAGEDRG